MEVMRSGQALAKGRRQEREEGEGRGGGERRARKEGGSVRRGSHSVESKGDESVRPPLAFTGDGERGTGMRVNVFHRYFISHEQSVSVRRASGPATTNVRNHVTQDADERRGDRMGYNCGFTALTGRRVVLVIARCPCMVAEQ